MGRNCKEKEESGRNKKVTRRNKKKQEETLKTLKTF